MNIEQLKGQRLRRDFSLKREAINEAEGTVELSFSSETPVRQFFGYEILDHSEGSCDLTLLRDGGAFLDMHDWEKQIGVVASVRIDPDKVGRAVMKMSKNPDPQLVFQDMKDGIRTKVSVAYTIDELILEKEEEGVRTYRIKKWTPYEISSVSVPADHTVGIGRSKDKQDAEDEKRIMQMIERALNKHQITINHEEANMADEVKTPEQLEAERVSEIRAIQKQYGSRIKGGEEKMKILADDAINLKRSAEHFAGFVFREVNDDKPIQQDPSQLDLNERELEQYSVCKAILVAAGKISRNEAKREIEMSDEIAKRGGLATNGIYIPSDIPASGVRMKGRRDQTTASDAAGKYLVQTTNMGDRFIDLLMNKMVGGAAGVTYMYGLRDSITIPKLSAGATFAFGSTTSESSLTFGQVSLTPKTGGTYVDYDYKLLLQSNPSIETVVRRNLIASAAIGGDYAILHGGGTTEPTGVASTSNVGSVDGAGIGRPGKLEFETDIAEANGDVATMSYILRPTARQILKERAEVSSYPKYLMDDNGFMNGYPSFVSNQAASGYVFFGDWSTVLVGIYGGIELLPDALTQATSFLFRMHVRMAMDVAVQIPGKLTVCSNLS